MVNQDYRETIIRYVLDASEEENKRLSDIIRAVRADGNYRFAFGNDGDSNVELRNEEAWG